ncbi:YbbR-like domain-containing protein [Parabacteroides sp. PF5-9]|uniref:YbbR-like domain-containing protein n=1 Tax=Parabacteroides sp. PF5-9 TaxID=1742404 RepID=UPI0024760DBC|nr:YbbR-like domain-containing protein [Parabacteroides sp. PF5-9]MDH6358975.1 hypothetical protein [Parabacteroides sp. PF5-9]
MLRLEQIKISFKSTLIKIKAFLHSQQWREALIFFGFFLLSSGFWLLQSLQQDYEIELSIPIKYKNIPVDIDFTEQPPEKIIAHVKDKGTTLMNYSFGRKFSSLEINMRNAQNKNGGLVIDRRDIESDILKQLLTTTALIGIEPSQIELKYSTKEHKEIPVVFHGNMTLEPGFQISGDTTIIPDKVNVYAVKSILDTLTEARTVYTDIKGVNRSISREFQLQQIQGVSYEPTAVNITIPVDEFTERIIEVPVICTDIPQGFTVRMFPPKINVTCNIPVARFRDLSENQFSIQIPFSLLEQNLTGRQMIQLNKWPEWIRSFTLVPDHIEFIIEQTVPT